MINFLTFQKNLTKLQRRKKKKIIIINPKPNHKKLVFLNKKNLKKKVFFNLIHELNNSKYLVVNNLNNYNLNSKKIDLELNAKLINTAQSRLLKLPFSGTTKLIPFTSLTELKEKINVLLLNKLNFKIICIKINKKLYLFSKIYNQLIIKPLQLKKNFVNKTLIPTFLKLTTFLNFTFKKSLFFLFHIFTYFITTKKNQC